MLTAPGVFNINADGTSCQGTWQSELQWCQHLEGTQDLRAKTTWQNISPITVRFYL